MIRIIIGVVLAVAAVVLRLLAPSNPQLIENLFSRGVYPIFSSLLTKINSLVPFSIFEYGLVALLFGVLIWIAALIIHLVRSPEILAQFWRSTLTNLVLILGVLIMWYLLGGGLNYFRSSFADYSGLEIQPASVEELTGLCSQLAAEADRLGAQVSRRDDNTMVLENGFEGSAAKVSQGYAALTDHYDGVLKGGTTLRPKPVKMSEVMSLCRITGLYSFYSGEANINVDVPEYTIPATIAHESAHVCGFMREDEANYIAFVVCRASQDAETQYSGTMLALVHSLNALARADAEAWRQIRTGLSPAVQADLAFNNAYWDQYKTTVGTVAEKANDVHLKLNDQEAGIQSYGRMVDLLLADWRSGGLF